MFYIDELSFKKEIIIYDISSSYRNIWEIKICILLFQNISKYYWSPFMNNVEYEKIAIFTNTFREILLLLISFDQVIEKIAIRLWCKVTNVL